MTTTHPIQNHSPRKYGSPRIENLLKNTDFSAGFEHWLVADAGNPDNCTIQGDTAVLKNNASIAQSADVEQAAPYTLRFDARGINISFVEIVEDNYSPHTIYISGGHNVHSFVTREGIKSVNIRFISVGNEQLFVSNILLTKDVPNPEELVKNGDFEFDNEHWETSGNVQIYDGLCRILSANSRATQPITGLVPGATYRISCTTTPFLQLYLGGVYISDGAGHLQVIELKDGVYQYFYDYQVTNDTLDLHLEGFNVAYDSISIKRVSVG